MADEGVKIGSILRQKNGEAYPLVEDTSVLGGFHVVASWATIPQPTSTDGSEKLLKTGMLVKLQSTASNPANNGNGENLTGVEILEWDGSYWTAWSAPPATGISNIDADADGPEAVGAGTTLDIAGGTNATTTVSSAGATITATVNVSSTTTPTAGAIPEYDGDDDLIVPSVPSSGTAATSKDYVDGEISTAVAANHAAKTFEILDGGIATGDTAVLTAANDTLQLDTLATAGGLADFLALTATGKKITFQLQASTDATPATLAAYDANGNLTAVLTGFEGANSVMPKSYIDQIAQGFRQKAPVRAVTTTGAGVDVGTWVSGGGGNGVGDTITGVNLTTLANFDNISSALVADDRVLVNTQVDATQNGLYYVSDATTPTSAVLTRATDFDGDPSTEAYCGTMVAAKEGDSAPALWVLFPQGTLLTSADVDFGTDPLVFTLITDPTSITPTAGDGVDVTVAGTAATIDLLAPLNGDDLTIPVFGLQASGVWEDGSGNMSSIAAPTGDAKVLQADTSASGRDRMKWDYAFADRTLGPLNTKMLIEGVTVTGSTNDSQAGSTGTDAEALLIPIGGTLTAATFYTDMSRTWQVSDPSPFDHLDRKTEVDADGSFSFGDSGGDISESDTTGWSASSRLGGLTPVGEYAYVATGLGIGEPSGGESQVDVSIGDGRGGTVSLTRVIANVPYVYYGVASGATAPATEAAFLGMTWDGGAPSKTLRSTYRLSEENVDLNADAGTGEYLWFAVPSSLESVGLDNPVDASSFLDNDSNWKGGFQKVATAVSFTGDYGAESVDYEIWRSDNPNLGEIPVSLLLPVETV
jgi:hypothetical protein